MSSLLLTNYLTKGPEYPPEFGKILDPIERGSGRLRICSWDYI